MMSSGQGQSLIDSEAQSKMPLFDSTLASPGLSKPGTMQEGFMHKQALPYSGAYYTYHPREKDGAGFSSPWSHSKMSLLNGGSPIRQLPGMEGQHQPVCQPDNKTLSAEESHSHTSPVRDAQGRQGFTYYTRSPIISSPIAPVVAAPVAVRNQTARGLNLSPAPENSVYLAIPKPVYGHSPCCSDRGCTLGHSYSIEHGPQTMANILYGGEWLQNPAHYNHPSLMQGKAHEAILHQRGLQLEHNADRLPLKDLTVEEYHSLSPNRARTFPAYIKPNYSGYPCAPTRTLLGSLTEQKGFHSLHLPHPPTHEHMTSVQHGIPSQVYQDRSSMSKYGQLAQRPMFYYPQSNMEVDSAAVHKNIGLKHIEDVVPTIHKHKLPSPQGQYLISQPILGEIPLSSPLGSPNHPFLRHYDHPSYPIQRIHLNPSQISSPLKRPCVPPPSLQSNGPASSPSSLHMDRPDLSSPANIYVDQYNTSSHTDQPRASPTGFHAKRANSNVHINQRSGLQASVPVNSAGVPLSSLHSYQTGPSPGGLSIDKHQDSSRHQAIYSKHGASPDALLSQSPAPHRYPIHKVVYHNADSLQTTGFPAGAGQKAYHTKLSGSGSDDGTLKKSGSHARVDCTSPVKKIKEERDSFEMEPCKKRQKLELERANPEVGHLLDSPPMPVIDNVFSLAPYKAYLEAAGMLLPVKGTQRAEQPSELCGIKPDSHVREKGPTRHRQQLIVCLAPKDEKHKIRPEKEKPAVEMLELKKIKTERRDSEDIVDGSEMASEVIQDNYKELAVKAEVEENGSADNGLMLVIKKCEPDEMECKPCGTIKDGASDECKASRPTADTRLGSTQSSAVQAPNETVSPQPKSPSPRQPQQTRLNLQNIPPHGVKLPSYQNLHPEILHPVVPSVQPIAEFKFKPEVQLPVRQHFLELHQSLCQLVSSCASSAQEHELRSWLSQLECTEPTSPTTKVQKVTCLLGIDAREVWMTEETKMAFIKVLQRLKEYVALDHCPFPHVLRTGLFIPMLVVKEMLFPQVQGAFIDQVLQEHRVELRPTTLSEEKILFQLHKRPCSSKLRKLLALKHLPDIYADVVNLFYHSCVCKHLGVELVECARRDAGEGSDDTDRSTSPTHSESIAISPGRRKHRVKSSLRHMFLESGGLSDSEEAEHAEQGTQGGVGNADVEKFGMGLSLERDDTGHEHMEGGEDCATMSSQMESGESWTHPLSSDDLASSLSDTEPEKAATSPKVEQSTRSKNPSGMILKLRRVLFNKGSHSRKARYQAISDPEMGCDPPLSVADKGTREKASRQRGGGGRDHKWMISKVTHRWQRTGGFSHTLRPLASSSKRVHRSIVKIKYCPYLSACHSAEHRRRWVLRSAVRRARRAMKFYYPDLVGKRIHHLYEEDDKSEVWYRGEVVCVHEANPNPLKTVFEVRYDSEPEWKYYLELLIDYKKGWLKIED